MYMQVSLLLETLTAVHVSEQLFFSLLFCIDLRYGSRKRLQFYSTFGSQLSNEQGQHKERRQFFINSSEIVVLLKKFFKRLPKI